VINNCAWLDSPHRPDYQLAADENFR